MPGYRGHLGGGVIAYGCLFALIWSPQIALPLACEWFLFTLLGALFPDIDIKSKGRNVFYKILLCIAAFLLYKQRILPLIWIGIISLLPLFVKHRGIFHSLFFLTILSLCAIFISMICLPSCSAIIAWDALFFFAGAFSHLILDFGFLKALRVR